MFGLMRRLKALWVGRGLESRDFNAPECFEDDGSCITIISFPQWKLDLPRNFPAFLRALPDLFPANAMLGMRAGSKPGSVDVLIEAWREARPQEAHTQGNEDDRGQLETPVTPKDMERVASFASEVRPEELCFLSVERPTKHPSTTELLLSWHQNGIDLTPEIDEPRVKAFADALSIGYRWNEESCSRPPHWCLGNVGDVPAFLRATLQLIGPGAVVAIGDQEYSTSLCNLNGAVLKPDEECDEFSHLHIPLTAENIDALESLLTPELLKRTFMYFTIVRDDEELLMCTRYGGTYVYPSIPKKRIDAFCRELGMKRLRWWQRPKICS